MEKSKNNQVCFKFKILNEIKDFNELTLIVSKSLIYPLLILLIKIINKESKYIISSIKKTVLIF
jgi:hypothetical protein